MQSKLIGKAQTSAAPDTMRSILAARLFEFRYFDISTPAERRVGGANKKCRWSEVRLFARLAFKSIAGPAGRVDLIFAWPNQKSAAAARKSSRPLASDFAQLAATSPAGAADGPIYLNRPIGAAFRALGSAFNFYKATVTANLEARTRSAPADPPASQPFSRPLRNMPTNVNASACIRLR